MQNNDVKFYCEFCKIYHQNGQHASYAINMAIDGIIILHDMHGISKTRTITNDAEYVLWTLNKQHPEKSGWKIIYCDSEGFYDEIIRNHDGKLKGFRSLGSECNLAIAIAKCKGNFSTEKNKLPELLDIDGSALLNHMGKSPTNYIKLELDKGEIFIENRPTHCDRGNYIVKPYSSCPLTFYIDHEDAFPRYYFLFQNLLSELICFITKREVKLIGIHTLGAENHA